MNNSNNRTHTFHLKIFSTYTADKLAREIIYKFGEYPFLKTLVYTKTDECKYAINELYQGIQRYLSRLCKFSTIIKGFNELFVEFKVVSKTWSFIINLE